MNYVYVLRSRKEGRLYIGSSANPDERLKAHNSGKSIWSRKYRPWDRILIEKYNDRESAVRRERYLKSGWGRKWVKRTVERITEGLVT